MAGCMLTPVPDVGSTTQTERCPVGSPDFLLALSGVLNAPLHRGGTATGIKASAAELGFAFDRHETRNRIQALCFELEGPTKLRLLLARSGEISLETAPLPPPQEGVAECIALPLPVVPGDWRLRHKTTDRGFYHEALAIAQARGARDALFVREDGLVTEGTFTNVFVERGGKLLTPPAALGLLPGILREELLSEGRAEEAGEHVEREPEEEHREQELHHAHLGRGRLVHAREAHEVEDRVLVHLAHVLCLHAMVTAIFHLR